MSLEKPDILIAVILILLTTIFVMKLIRKLIVSIVTIGIVTTAVFLFMQTGLYKEKIMPSVNSFLGTRGADRVPPAKSAPQTRHGAAVKQKIAGRRSPRRGLNKYAGQTRLPGYRRPAAG